VGRVIAAVFSIALLIVSMYLFGAAFQVGDTGAIFVFLGGILLMAISFALPIHVFSKR